MRSLPPLLHSTSLAIVLLGCAGKPLPPPSATVAPPAQVPAAAPTVEKVREYLEVTPLELFFSGVRGVTQASETVSLKNTGPEPMQIIALQVVGKSAATFRVTDAPGMPSVLAPSASLTFQVKFAPSLETEPGVHRARVRILRPNDDEGPPVDFSGLVIQGTSPEDEPSLQQILESLGYSVDVGGTNLALPPSPAGDEVKSSRLARAKAGNVGLYLIARFGEAVDAEFGTYAPGKAKPVLRKLGGVGATSLRTLSPELLPDSQTNFDAGDGPFGLYVKIGKRVLYSEDQHNPAGKHHARVFPLRTRGKSLVPDAYVVAFDEDKLGDFQDFVFLLWNVKVLE